MKKDYYDDWADYLKGEEKWVYNEVMDWEKKSAGEPDLFQRLSLPLVNELQKLSPELLATITHNLREILKSLRDYSHMTINEEAIAYKISLKCSQTAAHSDFIKQIPVTTLDRAAKECITFNTAAASISGGVTGAIGFSGFIMDLPLLYAFLFRIIQETAVCFGYPIDTPEEKHYVLKILELGHIPEDTSRKCTITELHTLHSAIRGGVSLNQLEARGLIRGLDHMARRIGLSYSRRKLLIGFMIIGGITGAGMNYLLARQVSEAAYNTYRKRFIMDRAMARRLKRI